MYKKIIYVLFTISLFASCSETKYSVTLIGNNHCAFASQTDTAIRGRNYIVKTQLDKGYTLIEEDIKITVGNFELIPTCFTFNENDSTILVKGEYVSDNIKIEILGIELKTSTFTLTLGNGYKPFSEESPYKLIKSIDIELAKISVDIAPLNGKKVNTNISVFDSEGSLNPSKYSFSDNKDGTYTFLMNDKNEFYRDINVIVPDAINEFNV